MKDTTMIKTPKISKTKKWSYAPVQALQHISVAEFALLSWMLFRNNLKFRYKFYISTMVKECGMSKPTILKLCKRFVERNFLIQDDWGHYHLNYDQCHQWITTIIETPTGKESLPPLVKKIDQTGKAILPTGKESLPPLVKKIDHTSSSKVCPSSISKEVLSIREPVLAAVTGPELDKMGAAYARDLAELDALKKAGYPESSYNERKKALKEFYGL